jgi:hypothetical protein
VSLWKTPPGRSLTVPDRGGTIPAMYFAFRKMAARYYGEMNGVRRED